MRSESSHDKRLHTKRDSSIVSLPCWQLACFSQWFHQIVSYRKTSVKVTVTERVAVRCRGRTRLRVEESC